MTAGKGRRTALALTILGFGLIAIAAVAFRGDLHEQWLLYRLDSGDPDVRIRAAETLADLRSLLAAPKIVLLIAAEQREQAIAQFRNGQPQQLYLTPLYHVLFRLGPQIDPLATRQIAEIIENHPQKTSVVANLEVIEKFRSQETLSKVRRVEYGFQLPLRRTYRTRRLTRL